MSNDLSTSAGGVLPITLDTTHTFITIFGSSAAQSITVNGHTWVADPTTHLYQTTTDLAAEWQTCYLAMQNGQGASLNDIQRLEGNAQAVFDNTALSKLSTSQLSTDRQDTQRELDAIFASMVGSNVSLNAPMTKTQYLSVENSLQSNDSLSELAMQGHGLDGTGLARYAGYSKDFQNNGDKTILFIGGGLNNNTNAVANFFDDNILSNMPFAVVEHIGTATQLNENANAENTLTQALSALDDSMFYRTYSASDFASTASSTHVNFISPALTFLNAQTTTAPKGCIVTLEGYVVSGTITTTTHTWQANASGTFETSADLATEWSNAYQDLINNGGTNLTPELRLEANAQSVLLNTGLAKASATLQTAYRVDLQRQFDAQFAAMTLASVDPNAPLMLQTYLSIEHTMQSNPQLEELALQGHGLNDTTFTQYKGYTDQIQNRIDNKTLYVGPGLDHNEAAIPNLVDDVILSHMPFAVVVKNGQLKQLNQNGNIESLATDAVTALNATMHTTALQPQDFSLTKA
jgi:hypothetical protein